MDKKEIMNIVISGQHFGITAALGYFIDAARRRENVRVITTGPAHGVNMPYGTVSIISEKYVRTPDIDFPPMDIGDSYVPINMVESRLPSDFIPDLWLDVDAGFHLEGKPEHGKNCLFETDPHTGLRQIYNRTKPFYDYVFNPQTEYTDGEEYYLPYAADPIYNCPLEVEKIYDVCIIGNYYPSRVELIDILRAQGKNCFFQLGLSKEDSQLIMSQSRICINWSSMNDLTARCFEAMGSGNILLANRVKDLNALFVENEDFYGFSELNEAVDKVHYILSNPDEADKVAKSGRQAIIDGHHYWDDRLDKIIKVAGL